MKKVALLLILSAGLLPSISFSKMGNNYNNNMKKPMMNNMDAAKRPMMKMDATKRSMMNNMDATKMPDVDARTIGIELEALKTFIYNAKKGDYPNYYRMALKAFVQSAKYLMTSSVITEAQKKHFGSQLKMYKNELNSLKSKYAAYLDKWDYAEQVSDMLSGDF